MVVEPAIVTPPVSPVLPIVTAPVVDPVPILVVFVPALLLMVVEPAIVTPPVSPVLPIVTAPVVDPVPILVVFVPALLLMVVGPSTSTPPVSPVLPIVILPVVVPVPILVVLVPALLFRVRLVPKRIELAEVFPKVKFPVTFAVWILVVEAFVAPEELLIFTFPAEVVLMETDLLFPIRILSFVVATVPAVKNIISPVLDP